MAMSEPSSRCTSIERSGDSSTLAPSICERKVTAFSLTLRSSDSDITWKPPESVSIGPFQPVKRLQAAERGDPLGARPQHQMIGVAEHDIGAGVAHLAPVHALHRARGADRHEGRRPHHAMRRGQPAGAGGAVGGEQFEMVGKAHGSAYGVTSRPVQPRWSRFSAQNPLTAAKLSRISPRHDDPTKRTAKTTSPSGGSGGVRA